MTDSSEPERNATAWCFSGPAVFLNPMSRAINPLPAVAGGTKLNFTQVIIHEIIAVMNKNIGHMFAEKVSFYSLT